MKIHLKYLSYVLKHKWYVFKECALCGLVWRGLVHDISKFRPDEWTPYMRYYFGNKDTNRYAFKRAWLKHQNRNDHHWQYWVDIRGNAVAMPRKCIVEMVCDWIGAGKAKGKRGDNEVKDWYNQNKYDMVLHKQTRQIVEELIADL